MTKKRGLGRSLEALLTKPSAATEAAALSETTPDSSAERLAFLSLTNIQPGKYQPRRDMNPENLQELAESIRAQGVIQPIVVRQLPGQQKYEIIAGERRWRASQLAGLSEIPVIIRDLPDEAVVAIALIENIQRESLNPIEEADALQKLIQEFKMTHQQVAEAVGKSRASISNSLRLLSLNEEVKALLENSQLEMGHARALLTLPSLEQLEIARIIAHQGLSVRQAEQLVRQRQSPPAERQAKPQDPDLKRLQNSLSHRLGGIRVQIESKAQGKGKIIIHYNNINEFDTILTRLPETEG